MGVALAEVAAGMRPATVRELHQRAPVPGRREREDRLSAGRIARPFEAAPGDTLVLLRLDYPYKVRARREAEVPSSVVTGDLSPPAKRLAPPRESGRPVRSPATPSP